MTCAKTRAGTGTRCCGWNKAVISRHWNSLAATGAQRRCAGLSPARRQLLHIACLVLGGAVSGTAVTGESRDSPEGRHRLDLSVVALDAAEGDIYTALPAYTYTFENRVRLGITGNYTFISASDAGKSLGIDSGSGLGDTDFNLQFNPPSELTSSPWVPDNLGLTAGLTAPTGDPEKSLGSDQWAYRIGFGWGFNIPGSLYLVPSAEYGRSFREGSEALGMEYLGFALSLNYVFSNGLWVGYVPYLQRDLALHEWADDHSLVIGRMWPNGFGASLEYAQRRRLDKTARRDDYTGLVSVYYQFGSPP